MVSVIRSKDDHWPTLETLLMIEKTIKEADLPLKRTELWKALPKKMMYQTFKKALEYLDASGKIIIDGKGRVIWVAIDNPRLQKLFNRAVRVR
jgi:hypothetical protein